jgi:signal transduction histidine kinase
MEIELLKKALKREKLARKEAESILEKKSLELYNANLRLQEVITNTNLFPEENPNPVMRCSGHKYDLIYANKHGKEITSFLNSSSSRIAKENFTRELSFSFEKGTPNQFDMAIENKTMRFSIVPFPLKNYINIYAADITDIKATEVRMQNITATLKQAQQLARMGSWELDIASNHMSWSKELFHVLQVDPEKFIPSHENYLNLLHPEDKQIGSNAFNNAIKDKEEYVLTQRRIFDNKEDIYLECRGQIDLGKDGEVKRLYGICLDVSDKVKAQHAKEDFTKELEVKVKVRTKELEESLEREKEMGLLKTSFVSMASHQFRTPLAVIQSNTELLEIYTSKSEKKELEKYKKVTDRIILAISNMTELMDEVLILGKLTSRNIHYRPKYIDLVELLEGLIIQFNSIQKDDRLLDFEIKGIPYQIFLDSKLLSHALENLISNAFKYSVKRKNPKLQLVFKPQELSIIVQDYGLGIPSEEIENLFQPFFRAENVTEIRGTGLGLSIAKEYIEINKGEIEAKSTLREGSCFEIKFKY